MCDAMTARRKALCLCRLLTTRRLPNLMTNPALDPVGKIPEFKYCAVAIRAGGDLATNIGFNN
jgi:hypothetical protein